MWLEDSCKILELCSTRKQNKKKANEEVLMMKMSTMTFNSTNYQWTSSHKNYNLKPYGNGNKSILVTNVENIKT
jgi:hypothetical protein